MNRRKRRSRIYFRWHMEFKRHSSDCHGEKSRVSTMYDQRGRIDLVRCGQSHLRHRRSELRSSSEWSSLSLQQHSDRNTRRSFRNNSMCILGRTIPCSTWRGPMMVSGCPFVYRVPCNCIMLTHINTCKTWTSSPTSRRWSVGRENLSMDSILNNGLATEKAGLYFVHISALTIACRRLWIGTGNGIIISVPLTDSK